MTTKAEHIATLNGFLTLPPDWDGYGAPPVTPYAIETATATLDDFDAAQLDDLFICPSVHGGVRLEWCDGDREFGIEFPADRSGIGHWYKVNAAGEDEQSFTHGMTWGWFAAWLRDNYGEGAV